MEYQHLQKTALVLISYFKLLNTRYRPPELLLGERHYGPPVDMWGAGCVMAEMWTRSPIMQVHYFQWLCRSPDRDQSAKMVPIKSWFCLLKFRSENFPKTSADLSPKSGHHQYMYEDFPQNDKSTEDNSLTMIVTSKETPNMSLKHLW